MTNSNLKKNYLWNTIGTSLFSFNSLFYLIIVTRINGVEDGGVFSFSFATASIINFIALYYGRTYQIADDNSFFSESTYVCSRYITSMFALLIIIAFILFNDYPFDKTMVLLSLCIVKCFEAISDVYYGILQKRDKLFIAGKSMTYKAITSILGFFLLSFVTKNLVLCCAYLVVVNLLFLLFYDIQHVRKVFRVNLKVDFRTLFSLLSKSIYTFLFTFLVMIIINLPRYFIDFLMDDKAQGIYGIISMPATFIILFSQFILQPALLRLSVFYNENRKMDYQNQINKISAIILLSLIIILPLTYLFGVPILEFVYKVPLADYKELLLLVIVGSAFYAVSNILLNGLIIIKCNKEQLYIQIISFVICMISTYLFVKTFGLEGGIISYFVILTLQFVCYCFLFKYMVGKRFVNGKEDVI